MQDIQALVNELVYKLRKRKMEGSDTSAQLTVELLRSVISQQKMSENQAASLIEAVREIGVKLIAANPVELAVGNIVRRVLHIIREEELSLMAKAVQGMGVDDEHNNGVKDNDHVAKILTRSPSLHSLLDSAKTSSNSKGKADKIANLKLKNNVLEAVNYLIEDIKICHEQIAEQALELIHQNEVVLTFGRSRTVKNFLLAATKKNRSFQVFVAEGAPKYQGHVLAKELAAKEIQTTLIADSAVFAMISRVNMVIVGVHAVMANGGVIGPVGLNMVALAAKRHAVPFVVVAGSHKLCPLYPNNPEVLLNEMRSPSELLDFGEFSDCMDHGIGNGAPLLHVANPAFDYVPPELVSLFITDMGGHNPSFIHQLISEHYSADDFNLQQHTAS
ncbi:Initiation factor 2B-related protein [Corchorus capsularis]|uniref:Translation initiation factor eIF2B subunit beta n=1 Tax=Corchorus capsularis TaxID=210143 RepID=A0A1R3JK84_COCAP|nr:Initiation factor 2B-related protein [Corchorus capsularis]